MNEILTALETDKHVKVVVFDSAVQGFFLTHYDFLARLEDTTRLPPEPLRHFPDVGAAMAIATQFTKRLNLMHPIIQAPMEGGGDTPRLVAAVCEAGALGSVLAT